MSEVQPWMESVADDVLSKVDEFASAINAMPKMGTELSKRCIVKIIATHAPVQAEWPNNREKTGGVICAAWKRLSDGCVARCDRSHKHEGRHLDSLIAISWEPAPPTEKQP